MKIILVQDVENLGKIGEIVDVREGHARNYLIPRALGFEATKVNLAMAEKKKQEQKLKLEKVKQEAADLAKRLAAVSCTIAMPAGEDDKLFGAVTSTDIAEALKQEGIAIDKKNIILDKPMHKLGIYTVSVKLHPEITQELKVWVIKK